MSVLESASSTVDNHLDRYLQAVDSMAAMGIVESEETLIARLLHSVDKSRFGMECAVIQSWPRRRKHIDRIVAHLKNAEQQRKSEKAEGRGPEAAMAVFVPQQQQNQRGKNGGKGGHKANNTNGQPDGGDGCKGCGHAGHQL